MAVRVVRPRSKQRHHFERNYCSPVDTEVRIADDACKHFERIVIQIVDGTQIARTWTPAES